jgi:hypothetical protein
MEDKYPQDGLSLLQLQALFARALLQDDDTVAGTVLGDGLLPETRLAIYRHHVFTTLTEILKTVYPVVCRLVDERFFAYAADQYIRQYAPRGPCLFEYGAELPCFLAAFPPCRALTYLPDVARLEWAMHLAWTAEDAMPLALERLQDFAPHELAGLTFTLDPAVSYVASPWPIDRLWRANQPDVDPGEMVHLEAITTRLEVRRLDSNVTYQALDAGTFVFRSALTERQRLEEAFEAALAAAPDFCLPTALQALFAESLVVNVAISLSEEMQ